MGPFGLEKYCVLGVPPEVRNWVAAVAPAGQDFQSAPALAIRTRLPLLLFASLVADCWS